MWILFLEKKSASEKSSVIKRWLRGMKPILVCISFHMHTSDSSGDSPLAAGWQALSSVAPLALRPAISRSLP
jgi:hypothetical protein